jgi:hypothetical protein
MSKNMTFEIDPSQALARKRRKEILAIQKKSTKRQRLESREDYVLTASSPDVIVLSKEEFSGCGINTTTTPQSEKTHQGNSKLTCKAKVIKSNTKYQNRYEPEVPMSKEEEAEWRKEARRQRNRESAANSRNKIRIRIEELENEVENWKNKYKYLMDRIAFLENGMNPKQQPLSTSVIPSSPQVAPKSIYVPSHISAMSDTEQFDLSIPLVPDCSSSIGEVSSSSSLSSPTITKQYQKNRQSIIEQNATNSLVTDTHVIENTSRPAVSRM